MITNNCTSKVRDAFLSKAIHTGERRLIYNGGSDT